MKCITIRIPPVDDGIDSGNDRPDTSTMEFEATYHLNLLDDGTTVELSHIRGDPARISEVLETNPRVLTYDVVVEKSGGLAYIHAEASNLVNETLSLLVRRRVIVDWPIEYTDQGGLRVTVLGEDAQIRRTAKKLPDEIRVSLERIGDYQPDTRQLSTLLTDRQRQILEVAVEMGYYEIPRRTTLDELGTELGITTGTVGEHLRKIESNIVLNHF